MDNTRKIAVDVLDIVLSKGGYSNIVLNKMLNKSGLDERDKALATEIVYGTIKHKYTIDKLLSGFLQKGINSLDTVILNILRITLYQINYLDKIPEFAAVNEAVDMAKKYKSIGASKLVNGVLRNYLRNKTSQQFSFEDHIHKLSYDYSFEPWMVKMLLDQYGREDAELILRGLNSTPNITVRVNSLKISYEEAYKRMLDNGYEIEEGKVCPEAIIINKGRSIEQNPLFKEGFATVQDESAMLVAPTMDIQPDLKVIDMCSAPGGKATHISELMDNTGRVYAFDIHKDKLQLIRQNYTRLGITNIECDVMDAAVYNERLADFADRVLIDVPCSGLGIIRKKPEIKWSKDVTQVNDLIKIQREIMKNAAQYVKKDGILLYSTCTINKNENEENVKWFLDKFPNFSIEPVYYGKLDNINYGENGVTVLPNKYMDGFFIAKFKRIR